MKKLIQVFLAIILVLSGVLIGSTIITQMTLRMIRERLPLTVEFTDSQAFCQPPAALYYISGLPAFCARQY